MFFSQIKEAGKGIKNAIVKPNHGEQPLPKHSSPLDGFINKPIVVFTSIVGGKDRLIDDQITQGANFVAFTEQKSETWQTIHPYDKFKDDRRNSRIPKIMPHMFFDTEYSIWMDGNFKLKVPAQEIIDKFLKDKDIAVWKHPDRDDIYAEAEACFKQGKDSQEALGEQITAYTKRSVPRHGGLYAAGIIIRRHTPRINELNEKWWAEYCRYSKRDQLSFPIVFPANEISCIQEGTIWKNKYFTKVKHVTDA